MPSGSSLRLLRVGPAAIKYTRPLLRGQSVPTSWDLPRQEFSCTTNISNRKKKRTLLLFPLHSPVRSLCLCLSHRRPFFVPEPSSQFDTILVDPAYILRTNSSAWRILLLRIPRPILPASPPSQGICPEHQNVSEGRKWCWFSAGLWEPLLMQLLFSTI